MGSRMPAEVITMWGWVLKACSAVLKRFFTWVSSEMSACTMIARGVVEEGEGERELIWERSCSAWVWEDGEV